MHEQKQEQQEEQAGKQDGLDFPVLSLVVPPAIPALAAVAAAGLYQADTCMRMSVISAVLAITAAAAAGFCQGQTRVRMSVIMAVSAVAPFCCCCRAL